MAACAQRGVVVAIGSAQIIYTMKKLPTHRKKNEKNSKKVCPTYVPCQNCTLQKVPKRHVQHMFCVKIANCKKFQKGMSNICSVSKLQTAKSSKKACPTLCWTTEFVRRQRGCKTMEGEHCVSRGLNKARPDRSLCITALQARTKKKRSKRRSIRQ